MSQTFSNTTFTAAESSTGVFALGAFTGTNTLSGAAPVTINGTVDNPGSVVQVSLNVAGVTSVGAQGTYIGYSPIADTQGYVYYFNVTGANLVTPVTIAVTGAPTLPTLNATPVTATNVTAPQSTLPTCFATGTHILTTRGHVTVEQLRVDDEAVTASGATRPIIWIGRRRTDCAAHINPPEVLPIRIKAGAFGPSLPSADLVVSPGHRVFVNGGLVTADRLVNGSSIVRDMVDEVTYWHVELDAHDVLLAEGLPVESYLDCGNRAGFERGTLALMQVDLDSAGEEAGRCAPLIAEGPALAAVKSWLLDRAAQFGARTTEDPGFTVEADGVRLTPKAVADGRFTFRVPEGAAALTLAARCSVPAEVRADTDDRRALGVFVHDLAVDGEAVAMDDAGFGAGWHPAETNGWGTGRWMKAEATLPAGREVSFTIRTQPLYALAAPAPVRAPSLTERRLRAVG